jgi:heme-degrading monooxygenase HmoA
LSYLPLNKWRAIPKFMRYTYRIRRQLATSEGLIGYSLDANVQSREFWTLSVWEDEESLRRFAQRTPHGRVMTDLLSDMGQTLFFPFRVDDSSIPEAVERVGRKQDRSVFGANLWDKPLLDPGYARATRNSCSSRSIHKEARSLWGSRPL